LIIRKMLSKSPWAEFLKKLNPHSLREFLKQTADDAGDAANLCDVR